MARGLILWDSVDASETWLRSQVPDVVYSIFHGERTGKTPDELPSFALSYVNILAGGALAIGLKYAGSAGVDACGVIANTLDLIIEMPVARARSFPSSSNTAAIDRATKLKALCCCALALGLIMGGTGDIETFRMLRRVRKVVLRDSTTSDYGFLQAVGMAIGFLFLAQGALSFDNSTDLALAALLVAVYPDFHGDANNNRYYLQALRHLYVLATRPNLLEVADANTLLPIHGIPLKLI